MSGLSSLGLTSCLFVFSYMEENFLKELINMENTITMLSLTTLGVLPIVIAADKCLKNLARLLRNLSLATSSSDNDFQWNCNDEFTDTFSVPSASFYNATGKGHVNFSPFSEESKNETKNDVTYTIKISYL